MLGGSCGGSFLRDAAREPGKQGLGYLCCCTSSQSCQLAEAPSHVRTKVFESRDGVGHPAMLSPLYLVKSLVRGVWRPAAQWPSLISLRATLQPSTDTCLSHLCR